VTGTDTGVGKTTVSCALLAAWRRRGQPVSALKPLETGSPDGPPGEDASRLAAAAGQPATTAAWMCLSQPVAPEAAARAAGVTIAPAALSAACRAAAGPFTLVEGAGGLLVPIGPGYTMADLAAELGAAVLLVGRTRLGTINHTLLTIAECRRRGLRLLGVVLNRCQAEVGPEEQDNASLIESHGGVPVWGPFPYVPELAQLPPQSLAEAAERHLPVGELLAACMALRP